MKGDLSGKVVTISGIKFVLRAIIQKSESEQEVKGYYLVPVDLDKKLREDK